MNSHSPEFSAYFAEKSLAGGFTHKRECYNIRKNSPNQSRIQNIKERQMRQSHPAPFGKNGKVFFSVPLRLCGEN